MNNFFFIPNSENLNPEVIKHFKRNFFANLMDSGFWFLGESFVAPYTILPVFMSTLTDSPILIGMMPAMADAGWFLPQIFFARLLEGRNRRLPIVLKLGIFDRIPYLFLALSAFIVPRLQNKTAITLVLFIYILKTLSSGLVALPWQELIATVIPVSHRGRYWGSALIFGKLTGMIGAAVTGILLSTVAYPLNYGYMFLIGFCATMVSYQFLKMNIEPEIVRTRSTRTRDLNTWRKMKVILSEDKNFRIYLINRGFVFLGWMGMAFVSIYGIETYNLPISSSAIFTAIMFFSQIFGYSIWGFLGDRKGYKPVIESSNIVFIVGLFFLLTFHSLWWVYIAFGIISFAHSGEYIADQNIAMEFGKDADRPTYIGMSKTLTGPFLLAGPLVAGSLVKLFGYNFMFIVSIFFLMVAFVIIKFFVVEPRFINS
jgi:MFS family permease